MQASLNLEAIKLLILSQMIKRPSFIFEKEEFSQFSLQTSTLPWLLTTSLRRAQLLFSSTLIQEELPREPFTLTMMGKVFRISWIRISSISSSDTLRRMETQSSSRELWVKRLKEGFQIMRFWKRSGFLGKELRMRSTLDVGLTRIWFLERWMLLLIFDKISLKLVQLKEENCLSLTKFKQFSSAWKGKTQISARISTILIRHQPSSSEKTGLDKELKFPWRPAALRCQSLRLSSTWFRIESFRWR